MKNRKLGLTLMALFTIVPTMVFALFESIPTSKSNLVASNNATSTIPNTLKSEPTKLSTDNTGATLSSTNVNSDNATGVADNSTLTLPQQANQVKPATKATTPSTTLGSTLFGSKPYASTLSTLSKNNNSNDHDGFEDEDELEDDGFEDDNEFESEDHTPKNVTPNPTSSRYEQAPNPFSSSRFESEIEDVGEFED